MIALIDGDIVAYRCAASCEPTKLKPQLESREDAIGRLEGLMQDIIHDTSADSFNCYLGGSNNFRKSIDTTYKATRTSPPPTWLADCKQHLVEYWNAEIADNCEADDMLGVQQYKTHTYVKLLHPPIYFQDWEGREHKSIICSIDKDLLQIPGNHYNFVKKEKLFVTEAQGWVNFFTQMIMGDKSDNVMGYDGKARGNPPPQFLIPVLTDLWDMTEEEMFQTVWNMYEDKAKFVNNYKLLWIWRQVDDKWDFLQQQLERVHQLESTQ